MNSHLVTVHDQEENVYIQHRHNGESSWIGLSDRSVEGSFVWANKEKSSFRFWAPQQPTRKMKTVCTLLEQTMDTHGMMYRVISVTTLLALKVNITIYFPLVLVTNSTRP